jgi:DNA-binding ferritin-like protein (Dps family)
MKIRQGFVSNSSSSSFIIVGIKLDDNLSEEELAKKYLTQKSIADYIGKDIDNYTGNDKSDYWTDLWYGLAHEGEFIDDRLDFISDDVRTFVGKVLSDGEDYLEKNEFSMKELTDIANEFGEDAKLYFGTRQC